MVRLITNSVDFLISLFLSGQSIQWNVMTCCSNWCVVYVLHCFFSYVLLRNHLLNQKGTCWVSQLFQILLSNLFLISSGLASVTKWPRFISLFSSNATKSVEYVHAMPLPFVVSLAFWSGRILNCLPLWFILKRYFEILIETNLPLSY